MLKSLNRHIISGDSQMQGVGGIGNFLDICRNAGRCKHYINRCVMGKSRES